MRDSQTTSTEITMRTARDEADFWLLRDLLIEAWGELPPGFIWEVRRLDGMFFHNETSGWDERWDDGNRLGLWFDGERLVAAVHPEGGGDAWLSIRADYRWLEPRLLDWAEDMLSRPGADGRRTLVVLAWEWDGLRRELLASRGYIRTTAGEVLREKPYPNGEIPPHPLPAGYRLHEVRPGNREDAQRYAALLNAAFRRDFHQAADIVNFTANSPSFRSELELAAVAPDGSFAALTGMIYDEDNRCGHYEPVCATHGPRPLGLTGWLMYEGWRRVRELGAEHCYVGTGVRAKANRFYAACGFELLQTGWFWRKELG